MANTCATCKHFEIHVDEINICQNKFAVEDIVGEDCLFFPSPYFDECKFYERKELTV